MAEVGRNGALKNYLWGSDHAPLFQQDLATPSKAFFHPDHLGTTRYLTDSSGLSANPGTITYQPFGTPDDPEALSSLTNYSFTGQYRDDTGLQYHRARWLNTTQGRWLSTDPVFDFPGNFGHPLLYSGSNPKSALDINGKLTLVETSITAGVIASLVGFGLGSYFTYIETGDILTAAKGGLITGILAGIYTSIFTYFSGSGLAPQATVAAAMSIIEYILYAKYVYNSQVTGWGIIWAGVIGFTLGLIFGVIFGALGKILTKDLPRVMTQKYVRAAAQRNIRFDSGYIRILTNSKRETVVGAVTATGSAFSSLSSLTLARDAQSTIDNIWEGVKESFMGWLETVEPHDTVQSIRLDDPRHVIK